MKEITDQGILLFGMKIDFPANGKTPVISGEASETGDCGSGEDNFSFIDCSAMTSSCLEDRKVNTGEGEGEEQQDAKKDHVIGNPPETEFQDFTQSPFTEASTNPETISQANENLKTPSTDEELATPNTPEAENDKNDTNNLEKQTLKKPDKILPCPRCNSMDTKFCYYNNYNVSQPRHFCKSCQRYWTAGGNMRNVPVGAGRRKNKNSASHYHHITMSEALQAAIVEIPNGIQHPAFESNGNNNVLSFGSDVRVCESKAPRIEQGNSVACNGGEYVDDCSSRSSVTTSTSIEESARNGIQDTNMGNINDFASGIKYVPWPYHWNSAIPVPAFCPPGFPMQFYPPPPYWNCAVPGTWGSAPWLSTACPTINQTPPNLGKHSREGDLLRKEPEEQRNSERSILIPKTLRIHDPDEAAKSSIWATLGIKNESASKGGFSKVFQPKGDEKNHVAALSPALLANPAAFSRSISFQERS